MSSYYWVLFILIPVCILWNLWFFGRAYIKRMRNHPFPDRKTAKYVFRERRASGFSDKNWKSKHGGASNCVTVTVTSDELWVSTPDMMAAISERIDLECRVSLDDIVDVRQPKKRLVEVEYRLENGETRTVTLCLKSVTGFVKAMEKGRGDPA